MSDVGFGQHHSKCPNCEEQLFGILSAHQCSRLSASTVRRIIREELERALKLPARTVVHRCEHCNGRIDEATGAGVAAVGEMLLALQCPHCQRLTRV